jgi:hypothetical protein
MMWLPFSMLTSPPQLYCVLSYPAQPEHNPRD